MKRLHELARVETVNRGWTWRNREAVKDEIAPLVAELQATPKVHLRSELSAVPENDGPPALLLYLVSRLSVNLQAGWDEDGPRIKHQLPWKGAALCIMEEPRTRKFFEAIGDTVYSLAVRLPESSPIRVVDAGCGPIPILAIAAALACPRVRVTAIELNPVSCRLAREVVDALHLGEQIDVRHADACTSLGLAANQHLVISETMMSGLADEPMVSILDRLRPTLAREGLFMPDSVIVKAGLRKICELDKAVEHVNLMGQSAPLVGMLPLTRFEYSPYEAAPSKITLRFSFVGPPGAYQICIASDVRLVPGAGPNRTIVGFDSAISTPARVGQPVITNGSPVIVELSYVPGTARTDIVPAVTSE